jgi:hypothetical protein
MSVGLETETSITMNRKQIPLSWIIYAVLLIAYYTTVFYLGYRTALTPMNKIAKGMKNYTLGDFLGENELKELTSVYLNPKQMEERIQDVLFEPAKLTAPFVGDVPSGFSKPEPRPKTNLNFRIFLTGGSTAFGSGAPSRRKTIGGYLEEMLNTHPPQKGIQYEVTTYANTAWSTTHERIMIINCLSEWEPDLIISLSGCNDVYYGSLGKNIQWFRTPTEENFYNLIRLTLEQTTGNGMADVTSHDNVAIQPSIVARRLLKNVHVISNSLLRDNIPYVFALQPTLAVTQKNSSHEKRSI